MEFKPLVCIYMKNNPGIRKIKQYRRRMIAANENLAYIDDRPVTEVERVGVTAWITGGIDAENKVKDEYFLEKKQKMRNNIDWGNKQAQIGWEKKKEAWAKMRDQTAKEKKGLLDLKAVLESKLNEVPETEVASIQAQI